MYESIRDKLREKIRSLDYVMTIHAEEEMENDGLSILDIEEAILNGTIAERQKDLESGEFKYVVRGKTSYDVVVTVVSKLAVSGKMVIITVYLEHVEYEN